MKKIVGFLFGVLFFAATALAGTYNVTMTWTMPDTGGDLNGFECMLNDDNATIFDIPGGETRSWSGTLDLSEDASSAKLRAYDLAGQRGPWSEPAFFNPLPGQPVITITILQ